MPPEDDVELAATDRLPVPIIRLGRRLVVSRSALGRVLAVERSDANEHNDYAAWRAAQLVVGAAPTCRTSCRLESVVADSARVTG